MQVVKLIYTNSGGAILALAENAAHKLWKWQKSERNLLGKVHYIRCYTTPSGDLETLKLITIASCVIFTCLGKQQCRTTALAAS